MEISLGVILEDVAFLHTDTGDWPDIVCYGVATTAAKDNTGAF